MTYCVVPGCDRPENSARAMICESCGNLLWLQERYRPIKPLSQGGFGRTFLAVDEQIPSHPSCVIKQLYFPNHHLENQQKVIELFHQEALRLDHLGKHPQIPTLFAYFEQQKQLYLVQELIDGHTLLAELKQSGPFSEKLIWELLEDILPVLQYIHEQQVIHRDIKPANIMRRQSDRQLILIDFGIAKLFTGSLQTGTVIGTPDYMAPEQMRGKVLPASDLYSLGLTCLHLWTGISPSRLYDINQDRWVWRDYLPTMMTLGQISASRQRDRLGKILDKLLQTSPQQRYKSAAEVLRILQAPDLINPDQNPVSQTAYPAVTRPQKNPSLTPAKIQSTPKWEQILSQWQARLTKKDHLISAVGVDYHKLRDLLASRKWQEANWETKAVLCQLVGKSGSGFLYINEIENIPCEDLATINQLWLKYSSDRFGFTIQKQIFETVNGDYGTFCDRVGWPQYIPHFPDTGLIFSLKAPLGHLPARHWCGGYQWWKHAEAMAKKLAECHLT